MNDKRKSKKRGVAILAVVLLVLLPVLYVLSIGPAQWLLMTDRIAGTTYSAVYKPLIWITYSSETAEAFFAWYCPKFRPASMQPPNWKRAPTGFRRPTFEPGNTDR
jgi:hypothetical protein